MPTNAWIGGTSTRAQVDTLTLGGTWETTDLLRITVTNEAGATEQLEVVAGSTVISTIATTFATAFNASLHPDFTPITAAAGATTVTLTADTAGKPFYCTVTTVETGGGAADAQTFTRAATTANHGPNDFNTVLNWSLEAIPVDGDDIIFDGRGTSSVLYGLQKTSVLPASVRAKSTYTGALGTTTAALTFEDANSIIIGEPAEDGSVGSGSANINLALAAADTNTTVVHATRNGGTGGFPPVRLFFGSLAVSLTVKSGSVGLENSSIIAEINVHDGRLTIGDGCTITTLNQSGGFVFTRSGITTVDQRGGTLQTEGSGTTTTAHISGIFISNSTGTITTLKVKENGFANFSQSAAARTVSAFDVIGPNARVSLRNGKKGSITLTAGIDVVEGASAAQIDTEDEVRVTLGNAA